MDLYPEKLEIKNIIELSLEKNSMTVGVIFLIMIVFYVITVTTVVLVVNYNHNYNTATTQHICSNNDQSIQLIDKYNKLNDIMITKL